MNTYPRASRLRLSASVTVAAATALCFGQDPAIEADDEQIFELSPFMVDASEDTGYRATNTVSGTSLNTAIKDIPMAIEVVNQDFMDDVDATNLEEALAYSSGVFLDDFTQADAVGKDGVNAPGANAVESADRSPSSRGGLGGRFDNVILIRGFNVPFQNRDGFRYGGLIAQYGTILGGIIDTSNVSRMEVVRGPNSLLYGIGVLSGIVNVIPERPLSVASQEAKVSVGNQGYFRTSVDVTGPLVEDWGGGELSYRVAGAFEHRDHWTDFQEKDLEYYVGQLQYQNERWNIFLEGQYADQAFQGVGDQFIYDNLNAAINQNFRNEFGEQFNWTQEFGGKPQSYRITGPDTHHSRIESNVMANVDFSPTENFAISVGAFLTDARESEFDVNIATLTNEERSFDLKGVLLQRPNDPQTENPEEIENWIDTFVEVFPFPGEQDPDDLRDLNDYRFVRYWWKDEPEETTTEQYRLRMTYEFESSLFGESGEKHTFLVGRHDIKDEADIAIGNERIDWQYAFKGEIADGDPLQERHIFDHSVLRYNGEPLAQPGREFRFAEVWFSGHYGLYQGKLFNDRLGVILGARHDRYHARDRLYDRFDEIAEFGPDYDGPPLSIAPSSGIQDNPDNETFGFFPLPEGVSEYLPSAEPETEVTKTIAANYKLSDALSLYALRSEGLTPNTGARDGNLDGLPSERSTSVEAGIKFEALEGKLSGTVSVYKIERENALWFFSAAPEPAAWVGGTVHPTGETSPDVGFEPGKVASGEIPLSYGIDRFYFDEAGVELGKVVRFIRDDEGNIINRELAFPDGLLGIEGQRSDTTNPRNIVYLDYALLDQPAVDKDGNEVGKTWRHFIEKAFADRSRSSSEFRSQAGPDDFDPMFYQRTRGTNLGLNASLNNATGANVTYTDEATGFDLQLIYQPTKNWQLLFTYAHTEREATSPFDMVAVDDPDSDTAFGTEYDVWVRTFGRASFGLEEHDDDGDGVVDRVTKNGNPLSMGDVSPTEAVGGLQGVSLYTGSEDAAALWTKYAITEGPLKRFEYGFGAQYKGPAETSIPIGGTELAQNRFRTPPTPERWKFDGYLEYSWKWQDMNWRAQLNIYNLTDDTGDETIIVYDDDGMPVKRHTELFYSPRSYRLSLSVLF